MSKIGPNEPCPCGSNKKYKKCCRLKEPVPQLWRPEKQSLSMVDWDFGEDDLDRESNRVIDLINEGRLDEAEECAKKLVIDYPEVCDGHDRLGMIYEKRGEFSHAIKMYQKVVEFISCQDGHDEENLNFFKQKVSELSQKI